MLTLGQDRAGTARLPVAPRRPGDGPGTVREPELPPAVAVPTSGGELAERLADLVVDACDPQEWEAVLAGCAALAGRADLARAVAPVIGQAREVYGTGSSGVWYLDPEHDAARLVLALAGRPVAPRAPTWGWADHRRHRVDEVLAIVASGRPAPLLATPTCQDGALAGAALADRARRWPRGAGRADRHQARLRVGAWLVPDGFAGVLTWQVRARRDRSGTSVELTEARAGLPGPVVPGERRRWPGLGVAGVQGPQRIPTREADLLRWASPHEGDRFDAWAAQRLARNIDWWEADWDERRLFARLRHTRTPPQLPGLVLLCVGLAAKQPGAHQPAVAVTRRLLDTGLLTPAAWGAGLAAVAPALDPSRLVGTLTALAQTHPREVAASVTAALPAFDRTDPRLGTLVGLAADTVLRAGGAVGPEALAWACGAAGQGSLGEAARRLLAAATP